jgi:hypothetical protein
MEARALRQGLTRPKVVALSLSEPPLPTLKGAYGAQEINATKGRPVNVREVEFAADALPEQEPGEAKSHRWCG